MARKRCHQRALLEDGATGTTTPTTLHAGDLQKTKETSRAATAFDENHAASPNRRTFFKRLRNNMKGLLCVNRNPTTEESVDENVNDQKKKKNRFWQKGPWRKMNMPQESERLEELHLQKEKLTKDLQPTSRALFFMEQDIEQHAKHRQEQHNVVQLEQLLRTKQNEEQVHSVNDFLQQNAIEDIKEHNEKLAAIRGTVEWLKEGQDGLTMAVQQVIDFIKLNHEQMFHIVELQQHLEEALQANKDEVEGEEVLENILMNPIEPAGKQDCAPFQQGQLLKKKLNDEEVRFQNDCLQQNAAEEDVKQHNVMFAAISGMAEWLKEGQERVTQSPQQVKDIKRRYKTQSSRVEELERCLKEALHASEGEGELSENSLMNPIRPAGKQDCPTFQQVKFLKQNFHFNDGKRTHLRMENERIMPPLIKSERVVKKKESFRTQRPKSLFEAAGRGATKEQKTPSSTRKHEEPLLKIVLLQQQRLAWAKRNNLK